MSLPLLERYNGQLLLRLRPADATFIEYQVEKPYEIHLVSFASEQDFENFSNDTARKNVLHLKAPSIKTAVLIKGEQL